MGVRRRPSHRGNKTKHSTPYKRKTLFLWGVQLFVISICLTTAYLLWLDYKITISFEKNKWAVPARVYASPLELYSGVSISADVIERQLRLLGYEQSSELEHTGQFNRIENQLLIFKRSFNFWDGEEKALRLRLNFDQLGISEITDINSDSLLSIVRLEPLLIGKIYPTHNEDRIIVKFNEIPEFLLNALIAIEDRNFYRHIGIDIRGIFRAFVANVLQGERAQGGSTLTQQLVKNYFLTSERTISRKLNEILMALLLEYRYSKEEILSAYINEVFLGQFGSRAIHGFGMAAEFYFSKPLGELSDDQLAILVAMVRGASFYNPRRNENRARDRRDLVLSIMHQQGMIDADTSQRLQNQPLGVTKKPSWSTARYPAYIDLVKQQLLDDYELSDLQNEGLKIFTTLESILQDRVEDKAEYRLGQLQANTKIDVTEIQFATVISRISSGEIIALTGGRTGQGTGFNRAVEARRPIGSLVKPAIYLTALAQADKYNLASGLDDSAIKITQDDGSVWEPGNYDHKEHGRVSLLQALKHSYNLASVGLGMELGLANVIQTLRKLGFSQSVKLYPSLLLGSLEMTPFEVSQIYQTIANGGFKVPLNTIREVLNQDGQPLQRFNLEIEQTFQPDSIFLLNYILTEVMRSGTGQSVKRQMPDKVIAGKTGTTNDLRDSWFAGYGDDLLGVVWMGFDDNKPSSFTGASGALQIWSEIMKHTNFQSLQLLPPESVNWTNWNGSSSGCTGVGEIPYSVIGHIPTRQECE
jgi:penicillin-binding protein 1B